MSGRWRISSASSTLPALISSMMSLSVSAHEAMWWFKEEMPLLAVSKVVFISDVIWRDVPGTSDSELFRAASKAQEELMARVGWFGDKCAFSQI